MAGGEPLRRGIDLPSFACGARLLASVAEVGAPVVVELVLNVANQAADLSNAGIVEASVRAQAGGGFNTTSDVGTE